MPSCYLNSPIEHILANVLIWQDKIATLHESVKPLIDGLNVANATQLMIFDHCDITLASLFQRLLLAEIQGERSVREINLRLKHKLPESECPLGRKIDRYASINTFFPSFE